MLHEIGIETGIDLAKLIATLSCAKDCQANRFTATSPRLEEEWRYRPMRDDDTAQITRAFHSAKEAHSSVKICTTLHGAKRLSP
jgi:hypothetical protein